jgi:electron transfer flavoprotein-quinone oxidoreductase
LEYANDGWRREPYMSYTVLRATFDSWLAEKVGEKGGYVIPKKKVDGLLWEDGQVAGIKAGDEEIGAHIVIAADGALSFLAEKASLRKPLEPRNYAVAIKEIYRLDEKTIDDRFGLQPGEGAANLFVGAVTKGMFGGGFLYTNRDTLSLGIVVSIGDLGSQKNPVAASRLMEEFSARPEVQRWIRGGELKEYAAHIISEAGAEGIPKLYTGGMLIAGDAAGFSLNLGLTVRGMEFAVASGAIAAGVADEALAKGDLSATFLSRYEHKLKESFVLPDMETFRNTREVLDNKRLFTVYPKFISELLSALFTIGKGKKEPLYRSAKAVARKYILNWDGCKDLLSMRKM